MRKVVTLLMLFAIMGLSKGIAQTVDAAMISLYPATGTPQSFGLTNTGITISGELQNNGVNNITTCVIKCSDGITTTSYTFNGNIAVGDSAPFTMSAPYVLPASAMLNNVKVWVELQGDQAHGNDTLRTVLTSALFIPNHKVTFEEVGSIALGFEPRGIVYMDSMRMIHPSTTELINVHDASNTSDPMGNQVYSAGVQSFPNFSGFPSIEVDRKVIDDPSQIVQEYDAHIGDFGVADIGVSPSYNAQTHVITVIANVHFAAPINPNNGTYRLALVLTEDGVHGTTAAYNLHNYYSFQSQNQYLPPGGSGYDFQSLPNPILAANIHYDMVARKIKGAYIGSPSSLPQTITANGSYQFTFVDTIPTSQNPANMHAIVLLINTATGMVMNANDGPVSGCNVANVVITPTGNTTGCNLDTVSLSTGSYSHYIWSNGSTGQSTGYLLVQQTTTYFVTVTDSNNCTGTVSITITVNHVPPQPGFMQGDTSVCPNSQQTYSISPVSGANYYQWTLPSGWSGTSAGTSITVTVGNQGGYVRVVAVDSCGISLASVRHVSILTGSVTISGNTFPAVCGPNGAALVHIVSGLGPFTYTWSPITNSNATVTGLDAGNYTCTVAGANGCTATIILTVTGTGVPAQPGIISGPGTVCANSQQTYSIAPVAGATSYTWSLPNGWTGVSNSTAIVVTTGTIGGVITVTANDSCGSSPAQLLQVTVGGSVNPTIFATDTVICQGDSVTLYVNAAVTYLWSNGATTQFTQVYTGGTYTVTASGSNGCTGTDTQVISIGQGPNVQVTAGGPTEFCQGGSVTLTAFGGVYYSWSTGATTASITVSSTGYYQVVATDFSGCSGMSVPVFVMAYQNPSPTIGANGPTTFCSGGNLTLSSMGTYTLYNWSTGATTHDIVVNATGVYMLTVTDANGCTGMDSIAVSTSVILTPTITPNGNTTFCQGGSVVLNVGSYLTYNWSNNTSQSFISVNSSGIYSVTVSDNTGCTGTASITITVNPNPIDTITTNGPTTFCQGGSVVLNAGGGYTSYHWSTQNGATTQTVTITQTGNYRVTVTNSFGCTGTASQLVNVNQNPSPIITPSDTTTFCAGGSVILNTGIFSSYSWSTGSTNQSITVTTTGTYIVTVTNSSGCTGLAYMQVTVNANPNPSIIANGATIFCQGGSVMLDAGLFASYHWSTNATTQTITVTASGNYMVTVTNGSGCTATASQSVTANQNPTPNIVANGLTTFCSGSSVTLDAGTWVSYHWNNNATSETITVSATGAYVVTITDINGCIGIASQTVTVYSNPTPTITGAASICDGNSTTLNAGTFTSYNWSNQATTGTITASSSGTYSVTVTDNLGCTGIASTVVTVHTNPTPTVTANGPTTFCDGGSVLLNAGSFASYSWSNGATSSSISATTSGTFMVTVTDGNGCTGIASIGVTVNPSPSPIITANGPTTFCDGGSVTLDAGNWGAYMWNTGSTTESITVFGSQPYCVSVTDANGCIGSTCQFVQVFTHPIPVISPNGPTTFCTGGSVTLNAGTYPSYLWNTGATTSSITTSTTGIYTVTVINGNNCTASASISVTSHASPNAVITANGPTNFCQGGMVTLDAGLYTAYHWMNSQTTESILVLSSGTYMVTVTGNNGCTGTASQVVTVTPFIVPTIFANGPTQFCGNNTVTLDAGVYNTYHWSTGATTETITTSTSGSYLVTVSNGGNCSGTAQRTITSYNAPVPNILVTHLNNLCGGGYAMLTVGATFPSYNWSDGAITQADSVNANGIYTVTVTSTNGCTGTASTTITGSCAIPNIAATPTTNIGATYAMGNWIQPSCYVGYTVRISVHNANVWVSHTILPNNHYTFSQLMHNTMYDWEVQTNCNASQTSVSGFSAPQTFTTLARLEGDGASEISAFNVYPNPATDQATIVFSSDKEEAYTIRLTDITGREVWSATNNSVIGDNQFQMNLSGISKGVYMVHLAKGDAVMKTKIVVQ